MTFGLTPELFTHVKDSERLMTKPYLDGGGVPTIGYGHVIPSLNHPPITAARAVEMLGEDLVRYRDAALRLSPGLTNEPERRCAAITDFCFNCGIEAYAGSTLRLKVNAKRWPDAAVQMKRWVYDKEAGPNPQGGLVTRRAVTAGWLL